MNVYDFDKTIYPGDSGFHFWLFCLKKHPACILSLGNVIGPCFRKAFGYGKRDEVKESFYSYWNHLPDLPQLVESFWDTHMDRIYPWYLNQKKNDDIVITASPEILVSVVCRRLGVVCHGTLMDPKTGKFHGPNCKGQEKVTRFHQQYGTAPIQNFYSDSRSDQPLASLADHAYLTRKGKISSW